MEILSSLVLNVSLVVAIGLAFWQRIRKLQDQLRDNEFKHIYERLDRIEAHFEERLDRLEVEIRRFSSGVI